MKLSAALLLALLAARGATGATAYVSDELVLGVYAEETNQGQRLATLHSGARVETLTQNGDFTQVRLGDGTTGWVRSTFLITKEPAVVRVKQLEEELDRIRATTPALAEAAARSEVERLKLELVSKQNELQAARSEVAAPGMATRGVGASPVSPPAPIVTTSLSPWPAIVGIAAVIAASGLACGFWLGYATLARRIRRKFGGLKVY